MNILIFLRFFLLFITASCVEQTPAPISYKENINSVPITTADTNKLANPEEIISTPLNIEKEYTKPTGELKASTNSTPSIKEDDNLNLESDAANKQEMDLEKKEAATPKTIKEEAIDKTPLDPATTEEYNENLLPNTIKAESFHSSLPVQGQIVTKFGDKTKFGISNGIEIEAAQEANILSVADGEVIYAGTDAKFGNLVVVKLSKHENIYVAYAYMQDLTLAKGDKILKNDVIGKVGNTGQAESYKLYFAVRDGQTSVDPLKYDFRK